MNSDLVGQGSRLRFKPSKPFNGAKRNFNMSRTWWDLSFGPEVGMVESVVEIVV